MNRHTVYILEWTILHNAVAIDMNFIIALFTTALYQAAPLSGRSVDTHHKPTALDAEHRTSRDNNIAELLIPLLEQSSDNQQDVKHKKVIQVMPYEGSKEHENKGWRKLKSNKKQLVEITPLRRKVGNNKHLAYILSAAKPDNNDDVKDSESSDDDTFEDSVDSDDEHIESVDSKRRDASSEAADKVSSETDTVIQDVLDNVKVIYNADETIALDHPFEKDIASNEPQNDENTEINHDFEKHISKEKSEENDELEHVVENESSKDTESGVTFDSRDFQFGPGNNILFDRGSSESALKADEVVNEDISNGLGDVNDDIGEDFESSTIVISGESGEQKKHDFDEVTVEMVTLSEYGVEAHDTQYSTDNPDGSGLEDPATIEMKNPDIENILMIDRNDNSEEYGAKSINSHSKEIFKVLPSLEEKGSKCDNIERDGEPSRLKHSRDHKSYRLSFLFNK